jgi:hypothetical protein
MEGDGGFTGRLRAVDFDDPPAPSAISNAKEPDETTSMFIELAASPSFMTEPFPNCFSIWRNAISSAALRSFANGYTPLYLHSRKY